MASDEAASDDAASDEAASDGAASSASDDVASGPLVFRSTILQEQLDFRSALPSESSKLHFLLLFICSFRTNDDVTL